MDHSYIEEHSLIERYHQGRLPTEVEARFEEHFMACPCCQEELQAAREFRLGMKAVAAQETARQSLVQAGILAWLAQRSLLAQRGLLLAALLLVALPWLWTALQSRRLNSRLEQAQSEATDWQQRYQAEQQESDSLQTRLERLAFSLSEPLANTPVYLLSTLRSRPEQPSAAIDLSQVGSHLALAVDVGGDPRFESFRLTLADAAGNRLWQQGGLQPNALEAIMVTFPASFFSSGDYRLRAEGLLPDGRSIELASFGIKIV